MREDLPIQLLIAGAEKAGTSSLIKYLGMHPGVQYHSTLEFPYFVNEDLSCESYSKVFHDYYGCEPDRNLLRAAKSVGVLYQPAAINRAYQHNPSMQVVVALRNPVDRAYSAYWYAKRLGLELSPTFEAAINLTDYDKWCHVGGNSYVDRGLYVKHLKNLFRVFGQDRVKVVLVEELKNNPSIVCDAILQSHGLPRMEEPFDGKKHNVASLPRFSILNTLIYQKSLLKRIARTVIPRSKRLKIKYMVRELNEKAFEKPPMSEETRLKLSRFYEPSIKELSLLIDRRLDDWIIG